MSGVSGSATSVLVMSPHPDESASPAARSVAWDAALPVLGQVLTTMETYLSPVVVITERKAVFHLSFEPMAPLSDGTVSPGFRATSQIRCTFGLGGLLDEQVGPDEAMCIVLQGSRSTHSLRVSSRLPNYPLDRGPRLRNLREVAMEVQVVWAPQRQVIVRMPMTMRPLSRHRAALQPGAVSVPELVVVVPVRRRTGTGPVRSGRRVSPASPASAARRPAPRRRP